MTQEASFVPLTFETQFQHLKVKLTKNVSSD